MSEIAFINENFCPIENANLNITDRGVLLADGLFETIRFNHGEAEHLTAHWNRLVHGASLLKIPVSFSQADLIKWSSTLLDQNALSDQIAGLRLTLTRGPGSRGLSPPKIPTPTVLMRCFALPTQKAAMSVMSSPLPINEHSPLRSFKSLAYTEQVLARQQAILNGFDEALLFNTKGYLVSATSANIFLEIDGILQTPPLSDGALPGTIREIIISNTSKGGIQVLQKHISKNDLERAKAGFITNSLSHFIVLDQIDDRELKRPTINPKSFF